MAEKIVSLDLSEIVDQKYLDYAKDVITDRALPDARDGLKPVQRRILWSMYESGYLPGTLFKKSARIVGDVMGKYHPHGDSSIYGALVKMEQDFIRNIPLIEGHGNFGTIDDAPAAMRYTEARLSKPSLFLLQSIKKDTVNFVENYEGSEREPVVLPAEFPNLLVNGASGIAVGMASDIPTHNLAETIDAACALVKNPDITTVKLMDYIHGPDFPTGGILSPDNILSCYETGRGSVAVRGKVLIEDLPGGKQQLVITELPYQSSKEGFLKKIHEYFTNSETAVITALRDESSNQAGMRLVIEVGKGQNAQAIAQEMYGKPELGLQRNYNFNMVAIIDGKPVLASLKMLLETFVNHKKETFIRRLKYELNKAESRVHILEGLLLAVAEIEKIVRLIKKSKSPKDAKKALMTNFPLSEIQAQAILDLKLQRLTSLEVNVLEKEMKQLIATIAKIKDILSSPKKIDQEIIKEMEGVKAEIGEVPRKTVIQDFDSIKVDVYIDKFSIQYMDGSFKKRAANYKSDRGIYIKTDSSETIYFFLANGECMKCSATQIPKKTEHDVVAMINESDISADSLLVFVSSAGMIKRTSGEELLSIKKEGTILKLGPGESLVNAFVQNDALDAALFSQKGMCIRFALDDVNPTGRVGIGVRGMRLDNGDAVTDVFLIGRDENVEAIVHEMPVVITDLKVQSRGGKGVKIKYKKKRASKE